MSFSVVLGIIENVNVFDPTTWNFIKLKNFEFPGGVFVYEYINHPTVDGNPDFVRLNLFLSKSEDFVTIWWGLLEPIFTESRFESVDKPADFDFRGSYVEELFKGCVESQETANHVFKALRIDTTGMYSRPQALSGGLDNKLRCDLVEIAAHIPTGHD